MYDVPPLGSQRLYRTRSPVALDLRSACFMFIPCSCPSLFESIIFAIALI
jgi:hypothetical protein